MLRSLTKKVMAWMVCSAIAVCYHIVLTPHPDELNDPSLSPPSATSRSAFAFVRFTDPPSSAAAIEAENGQEWLGRRIRVQYCESAEMKTKRRAVKYTHQQQSQSPPTSAPQPQQSPPPPAHHNSAPFNSHPQPSAAQYYQSSRAVPAPIVQAPMLVVCTSRVCLWQCAECFR